MLFYWDSHKSEGNLKKYGVSFELAQTVFDDPFQLSSLESRISFEERWITIGRCVDTQTLVVVHTYQAKDQETVRIISARKATKKERRQYEKGI